MNVFFSIRVMVQVWIDGASMNICIHKGVGMLLTEKFPYIQVIDCFNHRLDFALEAAFRTPSFKEVDSMLY